MTKVVISKDKQGNITRFTASGHTNYGVEGEDIVCAGASSIMQTAILGILMVAETNAKYKIDAGEAYLELNLPADMTPTQRRDCNIILKTMVVGLSDLAENYSDFVEIDGIK